MYLSKTNKSKYPSIQVVVHKCSWQIPIPAPSSWPRAVNEKESKCTSTGECRKMYIHTMEILPSTNRNKLPVHAQHRLNSNSHVEEMRQTQTGKYIGSTREAHEMN